MNGEKSFMEKGSYSFGINAIKKQKCNPLQTSMVRCL